MGRTRVCELCGGVVTGGIESKEFKLGYSAFWVSVGQVEESSG